MNVKGPYSVGVTGASITLSGSSASATIPNDKSGNKPKYVRLNCTTGAFVRWGQAANVGSAVATDMLVIEECVISTLGCDTVAALQADAAGGVLIITPLENQ